jgi:hypothetical protein
MLMVDEFPLTSPVEGSSGFAASFSERGPKDSEGRSLYQLDLKRRLFKYPCSFLIYSQQFDALPVRVKAYLGERLHAILLGSEPVKGYERLSAEDRKAISQILIETKPEFWHEFVVPGTAG